MQGSGSSKVVIKLCITSEFQYINELLVVITDFILLASFLLYFSMKILMIQCEPSIKTF